MTQPFGHCSICLGVFQGNSDRNTEVTHKLMNVHTGKVGIEAAEFRFQPLSKGEGGFKNRKAMRIALYGKPIESPMENDEGVEKSRKSDQEETSGESHIFDKDITGVFFRVSQIPDEEENVHFGVRQ